MDAKIWVLLAIVITVQCSDITVGSINGGHKIYDENKQASPALWRRMENVTIAVNESEIISGIIVTDLREEKDGDAKIVEGGEGQNNVTIELKSPAVLRGFDFHIEAYAIPRNQQTSTEEIRTVQSDKSTENSEAETSLNTGASIPISLAKNQISSSSESSLESSTNIAKKINQRQNRDTGKVDKFTQQINPAQLFTDTSTTAGISEIHPTIVPEGRESHTLENASSTQVSEQRHDFHVPKIQLHEFSRMPESTARNVPKSGLKKMEGSNNYREYDHEIYGDNKRYTHVVCPKFNINDNNKTPVLSIVNTEMPTIENDSKNKKLRKKRHMGYEQHNPIINDKEGLTSFSKRLTNDDNTAEIYKPNSQTEEHHQDNGQYHKNIDINISPYYPKINPRSFGQNDHVHNVAESKDQNKNDSFSGLSIPERLRFNVSNLSTRSHISSTDINKLSTSSSLIPVESATQVDSVYIPQHSQIGNQQSSITKIPKESINAATTKSESITEKQSNFEINSKVTDSVKTDNSASVSKLIENNNRKIRDTTMVNTNDKKETSLLPIDTLDDSKNPITTFIATSNNPGKDHKNALKVNSNNKISESNLKIPTVLHSSTDGSVNDNNTTVVSVVTEDMERNSRDIVSDTKNEMLSTTNDLKHTTNIDINSNQNKSELTTNLENIKPGQVTGETTIKPQENIEVPVELKSAVADSVYPNNLTTDASESSKQSERKTRDTKEIHKTDKNNSEKLSLNTDMTINAEINTSTQKSNTDNTDSKSAITSMTEAEKTITNKDEKPQQQIPTIVATDPNTTESQINPKFAMKNIPQQFTKNVSVKENSPSQKIPRDVKETDTVDLKNASIEELKSDISPRHIKVSSTESTFILTPAGTNKERAKIFENTGEDNKNESAEKSVSR